MTIVGFNFKKINVDRNGGAKGKVNISNNVSIKDVEKSELPFGKGKQDGLKFSFEFISKYEPKVGSIVLGGELLFIEDPKKVKEIAEEWKKNKKLPGNVTAGILNTILQRSNILSLILSQEVNLPPPIPLPKVKLGEPSKDGQYIG